MYKYLVLLLFFASCTPSKKLVQTSNYTDLVSANEMLKGNRITIKKSNEERIINSDVYLTEDSVFYKRKNSHQGIALSEVDYLFIAKKPSISKIIGGIIISLSIYSLATLERSDSLNQGLGKAYLGIAGLGFGGITLIVGDSIENIILKFEE